MLINRFAVFVTSRRTCSRLFLAPKRCSEKTVRYAHAVVIPPYGTAEIVVAVVKFDIGAVELFRIGCLDERYPLESATKSDFVMDPSAADDRDPPRGD